MDKYAESSAFPNVRESMARKLRRIVGGYCRRNGQTLEAQTSHNLKQFEEDVEWAFLNHGFSVNESYKFRIAIIDENDNIVYRAGDSVKKDSN